MPSEVNRINKELLAPYFDKWETVRDQIETFYDKKIIKQLS